MDNKIYEVFTQIVDVDELENSVRVKVFTDKELANKYFTSLKSEIEEQNKELDMDNYSIDEGESSYERYLKHRASEESISIWIDEDTICTELEKNEENDYEYDTP